MASSLARPERRLWGVPVDRLEWRRGVVVAFYLMLTATLGLLVWGLDHNGSPWLLAPIPVTAFLALVLGSIVKYAAAEDRDFHRAYRHATGLGVSWLTYDWMAAEHPNWLHPNRLLVLAAAYLFIWALPIACAAWSPKRD